MDSIFASSSAKREIKYSSTYLLVLFPTDCLIKFMYSLYVIARSLSLSNWLKTKFRVLVSADIYAHSVASIIKSINYLQDSLNYFHPLNAFVLCPLSSMMIAMWRKVNIFLIYFCDIEEGSMTSLNRFFWANWTYSGDYLKTVFKTEAAALVSETWMFFSLSDVALLS